MTDSPLETLPCGCKMGVIGDAFVMEPCNSECDLYNYALERTARLGKPIRSMVDPDVDDELAGRFLADLERRVERARRRGRG